MASMLKQSSNYVLTRESIDSSFSSHVWNVYNFGPSAVFEYVLSGNDNHPDLFVVTSISSNSMISTSRVIIGMLHMLEKKYRRVFIMKFCHTMNTIKDTHTEVCMKRDEMKLEEKTITIEKETAYMLPRTMVISNIREYYKVEIDFYIILSKLVNHIITKELKLTNVELLGKSAGGCIAIHLANLDPIYHALYLASPASPLLLTDLQRKTMKIHIGWPYNDIKYNCMKSSYDNMMDKYKSYSSRMYDFCEVADGHELHPDMICDILFM